MNIVHVVPDFYPVPPIKYGGIERMVYNLVEESVKRGHNVYLYAREGSHTSAQLIPYQHEPGNPDKILEYVKATLPSDVDIIHDHTHLSIIGRNKLTIPTVCTIHDSIHNEVDNPIYVSQRALDVIGKNHGFFVYNGVDVDEYDFQAEKEDYLLFLGVLSWHKGIMHALDIAEKTNQKMLIAGPVFNYEYFHQEVEPRMNKLPNVEYVGEVGDPERLHLLKNAKCLVFPTSWEEPFGLVMTEAMACGTPVIALNNGAVSEVMRGFPLSICQSTEEMIASIENLSAEPEQLRDYVTSNFSVQKMTDGYFDVYQTVINKKVKDENLEVQEDFSVSIEKLFALASANKDKNRDEKALSIYEYILITERANKEEKIWACNEAADLFFQQSDFEREKYFAYKSFQYDIPRAEICCRLGYYFLKKKKWDQAVYWYSLATTLEKPKETGLLHYEACWTWLPHIQLCVCEYERGNLRKAYNHNEEARKFQPNHRDILQNKRILEERLKDQITNEESRQVSLVNEDGETFQMSLHLPGFIEEMIINKGYWEPFLVKKLRKFMKEETIFIDVGANIGYHALHAASLHPKIICYCFEPHPEIYKQLTDNIKLNSFSNVNAYQIAVGDDVKETTFFMQGKDSYNRGMSSLDFYEGIGDSYTQIPMQLTTLDSFIEKREVDRVSVIKIDTQGNEYYVILGALEIIKKSEPIIAIEHHNNSTKSIKAISELLPNYRVIRINLWTGESWSIEEDITKENLDDYLFIPLSKIKYFQK